jgi:hypothetical protein
MTNDKIRENRLRRMANRQGLQLRKSRRRDPLANDYGAYWLIEPFNNILVSSEFGTDLDQVEQALTQ